MTFIYKSTGYKEGEKVPPSDKVTFIVCGPLFELLEGLNVYFFVVVLYAEKVFAV